MKRDKAWRIFQTEKVNKKKLNVIKIWLSGSKHNSEYKMSEFPDYLKKDHFADIYGNHSSCVGNHYSYLSEKDFSNNLQDLKYSFKF